MTFFILQHSCKIILFILRNFEKYLFTIYNIILYDYTSKFIFIFSELRMYPFLEPLDIYSFDDEDLDGLEAEDYKSFCDEYLMDEPLENQNEKHDICKKLVRNFVHLSTKGRETGHYDCVCLTTWLYNKTVSSNIPFDFIRGMYLNLGEQGDFLPNIGLCDYDQFEIIMKDPEKVRKFFYFSINIEEIKKIIPLGKKYSHQKALIDYINECIQVYEKYIGNCSSVTYDNILCNELNLFEHLYEELKSEFSESEYNIPELQNTPGKNVEKFSLKVEENALSPRDRGVQTDGEIAPGGMSTSKIVTMGSLIYVPAVSFYVFKVKKKIF
ncbi:hypothetical protein PVNG_05539 [Plasmodium vivax North Korean]|uniref:Variable surface protein n=1 Tax=Plasmodium vivax North Korean TaxID=1035514 RepID=A0A0J9U1V6_PLAVI|nr:hypothetical protein PVNG_05539 [Plasmodium vivax North Korean]